MLPSAPADTLSAFCLRILQSGDLAAKLAPARAGISDRRDSNAVAVPERPARDPGLELVASSEPLPRPGALVAAPARAACLARFAHHELLAVELFAFALLRWPELPGALRRVLAATLRDEQRHCSLYLERLAANDGRLADHPHSDYFWRQTTAIGKSENGPCAFLAAIGLTFEQANLDFTLVYRDAFRVGGDEASAVVCQQVHDDEVRHVRSAAVWITRLSPDAESDLDAYQMAVPFPLSLARAKARRFDRTARERAGLSEAFIEAVRTARSTQETGLGRGVSKK